MPWLTGISFRKQISRKGPTAPWDKLASHLGWRVKEGASVRMQLGTHPSRELLCLPQNGAFSSNIRGFSSVSSVPGTSRATVEL